MTARILHIILAISVLFSTTGILMGKHFCKQERQTEKVLAKTKSCCQSNNATCGSENNGCDKDCCSHEYEYFQSDQDKSVQNADLLSLNKPAFLSTLLLVFDIEIPSFDNKYPSISILPTAHCRAGHIGVAADLPHLISFSF
ncbi:MAG: hypothetical protein R2788_12630 [Saprospiraceae bacterium]